VAGKLASRDRINAVHCPGAHAANGGRLFFAVDDNTSKKILVDTGASYSIIPHRSSVRPSGPALRTANNMRIRC
jgi:hypothetical protein